MAWAKQLDHSATYTPLLELKVGAKVILLVNDYRKSHGLFNGSCGYVAGFTNASAAPIVRFDTHPDKLLTIHARAWDLERNQGVLERWQIPLRLGYALTIHRAQGCSLDVAVVDAGFSCE